MSSSADRIHSALYSEGSIIVRFTSGVEIRFPIAASPRLANGSTAALSRIEVSPFGLHWPELDEDLSSAGLLKGDYGQQSQAGLTRR